MEGKNEDGIGMGHGPYIEAYFRESFDNGRRAYQDRTGIARTYTDTNNDDLCTSFNGALGRSCYEVTLLV